MKSTQANRPRRSVLYVPASNLKAIEKARHLPCDAVILDLEDAVAPELKSAARSAAIAAIRDGGFGRRELIVRVNSMESEWGEADLAALADSSPDAILVPKIRRRDDLLVYEQALQQTHSATLLWVMIETAQCIFHLDAIAGSSAGSPLSCFVLGTNDLAHELRMRLDAQRSSLTPLLCLALAAARAHGLVALDGVFNGIDDDAGFEVQCRQGVDFGFDGKTLIHPRQIERCNTLFSPSEDSVAWAHAVIAAFAKPENAGKGALRVDGAMVESMHLTQAKLIEAIVESIQAGLR
jgi:citrate lyase subunit beta/citryl-CoA lyase